jgi:pimeloyl-ACP methyl ester carboxylesterase
LIDDEHRSFSGHARDKPGHDGCIESATIRTMSFMLAGKRIDYAEAGSGQCLVFVPGSFSSTAAWRPVGDLLNDRFRVAATSLLGCGETEETRTEKDSSIDAEAEVIEAVIAHAGGPVHLVGHSWGGTITLCVALRRRASVASLILLDANPCDLLQQSGDDALYTEAQRVSNAYIRAYHAGEREAARRVIDFWTGEGSFDRLPAKVRDYAAQTTHANVLDWPAMFGFRASLSDYAALALPVFVVNGSDSHRSLRRIAEILATTLPDAKRAEIAGASHLMIGTHPREVAALIADHVDQVMSKSSSWPGRREAS